MVPFCDHPPTQADKYSCDHVGKSKDCCSQIYDKFLQFGNFKKKLNPNYFNFYMVIMQLD